MRATWEPNPSSEEKLEQVMGFEPMYLTWQASVITAIRYLHIKELGSPLRPTAPYEGVHPSHKFPVSANKEYAPSLSAYQQSFW